MGHWNMPPNIVTKKSNKDISKIVKLTEAAYTAPNENSAEWIMPVQNILTAAKGEVLYNAVDTSFFVPTKDSNNSRFTFLVTGNIRKKSNYRITSLLYALKETLRENKNICLKIAGYIEDEKYLFSKINELNLSEHIDFLKNFTQKDLD